jgi:MEKHLA domain
MLCPSETNHYLQGHVALLADSYQTVLGRALIEGSQSLGSLAKALYYAPFVVVSHNTAVDPVFNYANEQALMLFGFGWEEFTQLPSRLSAEPIHQSEREKLLAEVSQNGYLDRYRGIRITKAGRRFLIKNTVVWNLIDNEGRYAGQAAKFAEWEFL